MRYKEILNQFSDTDSKLEVRNEADSENAEINIYGAIGGMFSDVNAKKIKKQIESINKDIINVNINSPGGDVFDSVAIHNMLKKHKAKVIVYIDGIAASGASVIAMAGDEIKMPSNAMLMIHNAWTFAMGNSKDLKQVANQLEKIDNGAVKRSYLERFVGSEEELNKLLDNETFLTAEESVSLGLADEVIESQENKEENDEETKDNIVAKYSSKKNTIEKNEEKTKDFSDTVKIFEDFISAFK